jgi:hypothetical protein
VRSLKLLTAVGFAVAAMATSGVQAAEPTASARLDESVRCFAAMAILVSMDNAETQKLGEMGGLYFMGRLDGALSDQDLEDRLAALGQNPPDEDMPELIARCAEIMTARGQAIQEIGGRVSAREKAAADTKK